MMIGKPCQFILDDRKDKLKNVSVGSFLSLPVYNDFSPQMHTDGSTKIFDCQLFESVSLVDSFSL